MISLPTGTNVWLAAGKTDMRRGFDGLAAQVQTVLQLNPLSGHVFVFRGRSGDRVKVLWWDGQGMVLLYKRIEKATFVWPSAKDGKVRVTPAQLMSLLEGMDWRLTRAAPSVLQPVQAVLCILCKAYSILNLWIHMSGDDDYDRRHGNGVARFTS